MNWIRQEKRLAIYLRDGLACAWCGASVEDGTILSLDHVTPHSSGGSNDAGNLVTACKRCNDRPARQQGWSGEHYEYTREDLECTTHDRRREAARWRMR